MSEADNRPKPGDRYLVVEEMPVGVLTHWAAPFTGGSKAVLPAGLEFVIDFDPPPEATAVGAIPSDYDRWEPLLVGAEDRNHKKYSGYSLSVDIKHLSTYCKRQ
jgi:hypothetical protein